MNAGTQNTSSLFDATMASRTSSGVGKVGGDAGAKHVTIEPAHVYQGAP